MNLLSLHVGNFGPFRGRHTIDLSTTQDAPLIVIGALNGGGKTSLLEAIRLALYGSACGNAKLAGLKYNDYLQMCINKGASNGEGAVVEVTFSRNEEGAQRTVRVARSWSVEGDVVAESVAVSIDGAFDESLSSNAGWSAYMESCLPSRLCHLFLFDGEQILKGATTEAGGASPMLREGIYALLGVEKIDRLARELAHFERKKLDELVNASVKPQLDAFEAQVKAAAADVEASGKELEHCEAELKYLESNHGRKRAEFMKNGGEEYARRDEIKKSLEEARDALREPKLGLAELAAGPAYLRLASKRLQELRGMAAKEGEAIRLKHAFDMINERDNKLIKALPTIVGEKQAAVVASWLEKDLQALSRSLNNLKLLGLPDGLGVRIEYLLETALPAAATEINGALERESKLREKCEVLEAEASRIPTESSIAEFEAELSTLENALQSSRARTQTARDLHAHNSAKLAEREGELRAFKLANLDAESAESEAGRLRRQASKSMEILQKFKARLIEENVHLTQSLIEESLQRLLRKKALVKSLVVDPESFELELRGPDGQVLHWQQMSAGEQQMVTTAIIWGLARASGTVFPMIVDTPLGRLDDSHRGNLLESFYPEASHQVVLLSTDKELSRRDVEGLGARVARTYLVRNDEASRSSLITSGYFN